MRKKEKIYLKDLFLSLKETKEKAKIVLM